MDSYQDFDIPLELLCKPQSLIAFTGLDVVNNITHKNIWEIFSTNRQQDRVPIEFTLFDINFSLPTLKPKRASYEWYIPKGVIKTNWMNKHLRQIPSVIVLFYELDWDDPHWTEKKLYCASQIHSVRAVIEGRGTKIAIVLIQKNAQAINAVSDDSLSTEKASELCTTCDLNPKLLLLLHCNEHLQGYIVRLENAFYELAQSYYAQEIRNIKLHKDHLNKTSHQYLFARHQYKIAFFNEMKHDLNAAHKHYTLANSSLLELRTTDVNLNEIKVVASFIAYKLCKLYFLLNQPRDAISQFNTYIDRFKVKIGPAEFTFEHYTWLSKQFSVFGDLFEEATRQGLPAVQTRHPGFYYEQAAQYAVKRKLISISHKEPIEYPESDPLVGWDKVEFYGQRPWRLSNRSEPLDTVKEQMAVIALQYRERNIVNHSAIIIACLGNAIGQFKLYRSPRKRRYLAVQMGDEYYYSKEYGKALTLFTHMLWEYRNDKWWELTIDLLRKALNCAYLTASLQEYVELCIEAMYLFDDVEKLRIIENVNAIRKKTRPDPEPSLLDLEITAAVELWSSVIRATSIKCLNVDMHTVTSFMQCKATFCEATSDRVRVEIWLRNDFPMTLTFSQLSIGIASSTKNSDFSVVKETKETVDQLRINAGQVKCIEYKFVPLVTDIGTEIQCNYILLKYGCEDTDDVVVNLRFSGKCNDSNSSLRDESRLPSKENSYFIKLETRLVVQIKSKVSKLQFSADHQPPSLISEWYPMRIFIKNEESSSCINCILNVCLSSVSSNAATPSVDTVAVKNTTEIYENINDVAHQLPWSVNVGDIVSDTTVEKVLYFKTRSVDTKNVLFKIVYNIANAAGVEISCTKEECVRLDCVNVFEITASFLSMKCEHVSKVYTNQPVLMRMQIDCVSPWPIYVEDTAFTLLDDQVIWDADTYTSQLTNQVLKNREIGAEAISFVVKDTNEENVSLGIFSIFWKRKDDQTCICTEVQLPHIKVEKLPLYIDIDISSPGCVRTPVPLKLELQNNSEQLMSFDISIEHNEVDAFMFSGCKQMSFNIVPGGRYPIYYNLFPLQAGHIPLPFIKLTIHSDLISQSDLIDLLKRTLPSTLFVMPQKKGDRANVISAATD